MLLKSHKRSIFRKRIFTGGNLYKNQATRVVHLEFRCKSDCWIIEETCINKERIMAI
jgi:hypothetical protein